MPNSNTKLIAIILVLVIVLGALGYFAYTSFFPQPTTPSISQNRTNTNNQVSSSPAPDLEGKVLSQTATDDLLEMVRVFSDVNVGVNGKIHSLNNDKLSFIGPKEKIYTMDVIDNVQVYDAKDVNSAPILLGGKDRVESNKEAFIYMLKKGSVVFVTAIHYSK